eukprot:497376-Rhodomonas_salina.3
MWTFQNTDSDSSRTFSWSLTRTLHPAKSDSAIVIFRLRTIDRNLSSANMQKIRDTNSGPRWYLGTRGERRRRPARQTSRGSKPVSTRAVGKQGRRAANACELLTWLSESGPHSRVAPSAPLAHRQFLNKGVAIAALAKGEKGGGGRHRVRTNTCSSSSRSSSSSSSSSFSSPSLPPPPPRPSPPPSPPPHSWLRLLLRWRHGRSGRAEQPSSKQPASVLCAIACCSRASAGGVYIDIPNVMNEQTQRHRDTETHKGSVVPASLGLPCVANPCLCNPALTPASINDHEASLPERCRDCQRAQRQAQAEAHCCSLRPLSLAGCPAASLSLGGLLRL